MAVINTNMKSSLMKFTFSDDDGEVFASFRLNPADVTLVRRCQEVVDYIKTISEQIPNAENIEDLLRFNDQLEDKICYLLGYDAKQRLFGFVSATSIMEDGNMFAVHVINKITEAIGPELAKRKHAMASAVEKHTAKYQ